MGGYSVRALNTAMQIAYIESEGDLLLFHEMYANQLRDLYMETGNIKFLVHSDVLLERRRMLQKNIEESYLENLLATYLEECSKNDVGFYILSREKSFASFEAKIREDLRKSKNPSRLVGQKVLNDTFGFMLIIQGCLEKSDEASQIQGLFVLEKEMKTFFEIHDLKSSEKDFITNPKPNGYQSFHLVAKNENIRFEVQFRTEKMHIFNENGGAAHSTYKSSNEVYTSIEKFCKENKMNELLRSKFILDPPF